MDLSEEEIKIQLAQIELREKQRKEEEKVKKQAEKVKNDQEKKRKQEEKVQKELERIRVKEMKAEKKKIEDQRREEAKLEKERLKEINKKLKEEKEKKKKEEEMVKIQTDLEKLEVKHLEMRLKAQMKRQEFIKSMAEDDEPNYLATNENDDGTKISDSDDSDSDVLGKKEIENKHNLTDDIGIDLEKIVVEDIPDDEYNSDESKNAVSRSGGKGPPQDRGGYKVLCVSALHPKASSDVVRDTLYRVFKKYGDISVMVMHESDERVAYVYFRSFEDARDAKHSKSRIILFDKPTMVEAVYESACRFKTAGGLKATFATEEHAVKGKTFDVKKLPAKPGKIYVGKIKAELSNMEIKSHFAQFGPIAKVEQPFDKSKKERKDFCFITFVKEDSAELLLKAGTTTVNGIELEVKKVTPKPDPRAKGMMGMDRGEKGGYGGGYEYRDPYAIHGGGGGYGGNSGGWLGFDQYVAKMGARGMRPRGAGQWGARGGRGRGVARYEPYQP